MNKSRPSLSALLITVTALSVFETGCFVIRGERRIKPVAPGNSVAKSTDSRRNLIYYRHFDTPDFNLNVGVVNNAPAKWELQFLFNILPCYVYRVKETTWPLIAVIYLDPKLPGLTFEPGQVFLVETNHPPSPPRNIWLEGVFPVTNTVNSLLISNGIAFRLAFVGESRRYINQDEPFRLYIEGIRVSGESRPLPPIYFRPGTTVRPGFRLPYWFLVFACVLLTLSRHS